MLISQDFKQVQICLIYARKKRIAVGVDLKLDFCNVRLVSHRVDLEVDHLTASQRLDVSFVVDVLHLGGRLSVEQQKVATLY